MHLYRHKLRFYGEFGVPAKTPALSFKSGARTIWSGVGLLYAGAWFFFLLLPNESDHFSPMKTLIFSSLISLSLILVSFFKKRGTPSSSIHAFKVNTLEGQPFDFASLKGKKILIVNTASKCGLTPQFEQLQALYEKYKDRHFVVIGFPCNQFASQDPGSAAEIQSFCTRNYGVSFPMMEKVDVKGETAAAIYKWLTSKDNNGVESSTVKWNFQKYMIDENGFLVGHVSPFKKPDCKKIINWIEGK